MDSSTTRRNQSRLWTGLQQGEISLDYGLVYNKEKSVWIMDWSTTRRNQSRLWTGQQQGEISLDYGLVNNKEKSV